MSVNRNLEQIHLHEINALISESNHAFLAPVSNPNQTTKALIASMQDDSKFTVLGYRDATIPISYIVALSHSDTSTISIGPMYVSEAFRGKGLGRAQVEHFDIWAKEQGYNRVFTKTWLGNRASRSIFETLGFVEQSIKTGDRVNGDSTISYNFEI